ncbi:hypothetical protein A2631_04605 [Candidatus Daviesbacteria bacterium RIFCSPHIGHO2_01_FULL_44_29]|uniref:2'-5' RNA ligase n=1 Tax=Candidatus Daviesbacteria bacterium RIFCSPHIGHO2_02_FULL_43_12 TaxID=1797776 RepID=A0A1F5KHB5_9BACT|nr:MAG: hypothetical protein A2631_04605 [Candidatus Daviesbacteria bacterium RIFCSPHIGHO2_01_FULL_44_29]OGE40001.1 MAG: hypothetical protein A3D25_04335 [Candidatus Daviesbacteria bacterium RIFCSPHIGHO2_02_FULL_43_12]OGE70318.1 MAG: hypothetical protein A3B55_01235 [Candidatus Daviesbacteria bacterium RIFCSPLOWO2_01_FULL_43_15]
MPEKIIYDCFIGVLVPDDVAIAYERFKNKVRQAVPGLGYSQDAPRITVWNSVDIRERSLEPMQNTLERHREMLRGASIMVSGLGYLLPDNPFMAYLEARVPPQLVDFRTATRADLSTFCRDERLEYHPHLRFAFMPRQEQKRTFRRNEQKLREMCAGINWSFPVTQVAIWGKDQANQTARPIRTITLLK